MTLPANFPLSMAQINAELGRASNATTSLTETAVRNLAGVPSGPVSFGDLLGKSSMTVTGHSDARSYLSDIGAGSADSFPNVSVVGGTAPFTYDWSFTSNPSGASLVVSNTATATVRKSFPKDSSGSYIATLQCVVTDNTGTQRTATGITAEADWSP